MQTWKTFIKNHKDDVISNEEIDKFIKKRDKLIFKKGYDEGYNKGYNKGVRNGFDEGKELSE
jgi:flagellar biosynthesis/type III secretory pathway protein FliH